MKKLTKREKILLGVSIVGAGVAGYFGFKCYKYKIDNQLLENGLKKAEDDLLNIIKEKENTNDRLNFIEFLVIESDCVPKALQNANNKLSRVQSKIAAATERLLKVPYDEQTQEWLKNNKAEEAKLIEHIANALKLDEAVKTDQNIYAK